MAPPLDPLAPYSAHPLHSSAFSASQRKCEQYWPAEVQQEYGGFLVKVKSCRALAFYTQRTFSVRDVRSRKVRTTGQSHHSD